MHQAGVVDQPPRCLDVGDDVLVSLLDVPVGGCCGCAVVWLFGCVVGCLKRWESAGLGGVHVVGTAPAAHTKGRLHRDCTESSDKVALVAGFSAISVQSAFSCELLTLCTQ